MIEYNFRIAIGLSREQEQLDDIIKEVKARVTDKDTKTRLIGKAYDKKTILEIERRLGGLI